MHAIHCIMIVYSVMYLAGNVIVSISVVNSIIAILSYPVVMVHWGRIQQYGEDGIPVKHCHYIS